MAYVWSDRANVCKLSWLASEWPGGILVWLHSLCRHHNNVCGIYPSYFSLLTLNNPFNMMSIILYCWFISFNSIMFFNACIWSLRLVSNNFLSKDQCRSGKYSETQFRNCSLFIRSQNMNIAGYVSVYHLFPIAPEVRRQIRVNLLPQ